MKPTLGALILALLLACSGDPVAGPVEPTWDRDACERCRMVVSERAFAAQIRLEHDGHTRHFDDLGCALLWLDEARAEGQTESEIWVRDPTGTRWVDAREAGFRDGQRTPMGYGIGTSPDDDSLGLEQAWQLVREKEDERRPAR